MTFLVRRHTHYRLAHMSHRDITQHSPRYSYIDPEHLRNHLKLKALLVKNKFKESHCHAQKFFDQKGISISKLREHAGRVAGGAMVASYLLLTPPNFSKALPPASELVQDIQHNLVDANQENNNKVLVEAVNSVLPQRPRPLNRTEEKYLEQIFRGLTNIPAKATLEGEHLNTTYGYIGAEQHLMRYPGDTMATHPKVEEDDEGMAPGRGAWGYFANSKAELTPQLVETEKWYAVVQTLYLPDWNTRTRYLRDWYKYRKVLIVNTDNGNAVVAAIADSGPAMFTGKSFGGSPEVMNYLGGPRYKKGPVVLFFVDDPEHKVPLGPVDYNSVKNTNLLVSS
jgi:hypothetical protein